jgi:hypothetical protein
MGFAILALCGCHAQTPQLPPPPAPPDLRAIPRPPGHGDIAMERFAFPLPVADARRILLRTHIFALGEMPPKRQVQAFILLMDQPDAVEHFRRIALEGETAGRLYALAAFSLLDPLTAARLAERLSATNEEILVENSDAWDRGSVREIVAMIAERHMADRFLELRKSTNDYFGRPAAQGK